MADMNDILNGSQEEQGREEETGFEQETGAGEEEQEQRQEEQQAQTGDQQEQSQAAAENREQSTEPEEVKGLKAAAAAERKKRQELEAEMEQLRQQLAQKPQEEEKPYLGEEYEQRFTETRSEFQQALLTQKLDLSESFARDKHTDYDEKLETFKGMMQTNPSLYGQMIQQANPAEWMYKTASDHLQVQKLREIGDPTAYETSLRDKLREELRAELEAEQAEEKRKATEAAIRAKAKGGFSEERSVGAARQTTKQFTGPRPMGEILK